MGQAIDRAIALDCGPVWEYCLLWWRTCGRFVPSRREAVSRTIRTVLAALALGLMGTIASATETVTYTYDAKGRLIKVVHTGTVNNNNQVCYKLDKAGNRTNV